METTNEGFNEDLQPTTNRKPGTIDEIVARLDKAYTTGWVTHLPDIRKLLKGKDKYTHKKRAKGYSIYLEALSLKNDVDTKYKLADIHRAIQGFDIDKPKLSTYNKFVAFVTKGPGSSSSELLNYMSDKPRGTGNTKVGEGLKVRIYKLWALPLKLNFNRIAEIASHAVRVKVKHSGIDAAIVEWNLPNTTKVRQQLEANEDYVSVSTVKKLITNQVKNTYYRQRYGASAFRQKQLTHIPRLPGDFPLDRVEVDSTVYSILYYDPKKGKLTIKLHTCKVVDSYSGKILGYAFDEKECGDLFVKALRNAFINIGYLPAEIFTDRFPGHNSEPLQNFIKQIKYLGCRFEIERTGNGRDKGLVEVTVNNLCELLKELEHFLGKNITTTRPDSRKSMEVISKLGRVDKRITREDVKGSLIDVMALYNSRKQKGYEKNRIDRFKSKAFENAIPLSLENKVWLFHKVLPKKVEQGAIIFRRGRGGIERFVYPIADPVHRLQYNGEMVRVRYNETDFESKNEIYLFTLDTDELICACAQQVKPHVAKINQTEDDKEIYRAHKAKNKEFIKVVKSKELELDPLSMEVSNYIISSKIEQTNLEELYLLRSMLDDQREAKSETLVSKDDDGKLFAIVPDPHKRNKVNEEPSLDRLIGYEEDDMIDDEVEPIMIVDNRKMKNG